MLAQQKNAAGRDAFSEATFAGEGKEEVAGWIEGFLWRVEGGDDLDDEVKENGGKREVEVEHGDEGVKDEAEDVDDLTGKTVNVKLNGS